ncbi:unnamed protein product [Prorocentrum cordatum]|uniref:Uncharacterized protein n=1 Tax=Prorocentrum cordatum TaxID=2364126 RepID=A0ABN9RRS0_9DINO|nr:unnamed protein product [Polarella glacialis]
MPPGSSRFGMSRLLEQPSAVGGTPRAQPRHSVLQLMGQGLATSACACSPSGGGDGVLHAAQEARAPGAARSPRPPRLPATAGASCSRRTDSCPSFLRQTTAETEASLLSPTQQQASSDSEGAPPSSGVRADAACMPSSNASFSSWVNSLKAKRKERACSEAEVRAFLQAHGFSDVNQLRRASRFGAVRRPLHVAVALGDKAILELLLLHGADPTLPDAVGHLPGHRCGASRRAPSAAGRAGTRRGGRRRPQQATRASATRSAGRARGSTCSTISGRTRCWTAAPRQSSAQEGKKHTDTINPRFPGKYGKIWELGGKTKTQKIWENMGSIFICVYLFVCPNFPLSASFRSSLSPSGRGISAPPSHRPRGGYTFRSSEGTA